MIEDDDLPSLERVRWWAARHGCVVVRATDNQVDRLDVLAELGGRATAREVQRHVGEGAVNHHHQRLARMVHVRAVDRSGVGVHGRPYVYGLTELGELLRQCAR
jgi:hypothetical protein